MSDPSDLTTAALPAEDDPTLPFTPPVFHGPKTERSGDFIDRYRLITELGEGGFGIVWRAEQSEPIHREVALKVIKPGMDSREIIARFEAERQTLALMDHPNIAGVLDAGTTDKGRLYFVMELVKGMPITAYCDENQLTIRQRLELFIPVCHAVQHAHQKAILHRDLKPSNILVTEVDGKPVPKVIDFGIAKALHATSEPALHATLVQTLAGMIVGTPQYMSPEQAGSMPDVDTRSDIYTLGVILYELLVGETPLSREQVKKAALDEVLRLVREGEPRRPSLRFIPATALARSTAEMRHTEPKRLSHALRGDLDWILLKALEKDRTRRYDTANAFAQDLRSYLQDEPVSAAAPTWRYQLTKFARRNRVALSSGIIVAFALVSATVVSISQATIARRSSAEAKRMLVEVAQSDRANARELAKQERYGDALAFLARACEYAPNSSFAAEQAVAMGNAASFQHPYPPPAGHVQDPKRWMVSPDGKRRVTIDGTGDKYRRDLRLVEVDTGNLIRNLAGHAREVYTAQFNGDGTRIITASGDNTARIWDGLTGEPIAVLKDHKSAIYGASFSPDGTRIVTASGDSTARIWDTATHQVLLILSGHQNHLTAAEFSPDGMRVVTSSTDRTARVWDATTGRLILALPPHQAELANVQFSSNGQFIVTADKTGAQIMWDTTVNAPLAKFFGLNARVEDAQFSADGTRIVTAFENDHAARVWDVATGRAMVTLADHEEEIRSAGSVPSRRFAVVLQGFDDQLCRARFSPDGTRVVTVSMDKTARIWDVATGKTTVTLSGHEDRVLDAQFRADGTRIVTRALDHTARVWDAATGNLVATIAQNENDTTEGLGGRISDVQFNPAGTQIVAAAHFPFLTRVWDSGTGVPVTMLSGAKNFLWSAEFSPDGAKIVTSSQLDGACVWDASTGRRLLALDHSSRAYGPYTRQAKFSADGTRILVLGPDMNVWVWNALTGKLVSRLVGHHEPVRNAEFGLGGDRILSAGRDGTARIWETSTGRPIVTLACDDEFTWWRAHFSPDGAHIITLPERGIPRLWDILGTTQPPPKWFGHFLNALGGRSINADGEPGFLPKAVWESYVQEVTDAIKTDTTRYGDVARYYLAVGSARPTHPGSKVTYGEVADDLITPDASKADLAHAYILHPSHPLIHLALARFENNPQRAAFLRKHSLEHLLPSVPVEAQPALRLRASKLLGPLRQQDVRTLHAANKLADSYAEAGRWDEALPLWAEASEGLPDDTQLALKVASLQLWFGRHADHAATSRRMLELAAGTDKASTAERAAKAYCLSPSSDPQLLESAVTIARRALDLGKGSRHFEWYQMALGMAEYRHSHFSAADQALSSAGEMDGGDPLVQGTARFYHAMSLFKQGKQAEAFQQFYKAVVQMKPLPANEKQPLANGADADSIILWLAYKEAKTLLNPSVKTVPVKP